MAKKTHTIHFEDLQWQYLVEKAKYIGISVAELIRQIINNSVDDELKEKEDILKQLDVVPTDMKKHNNKGYKDIVLKKEWNRD